MDVDEAEIASPFVEPQRGVTGRGEQRRSNLDLGCEARLGAGRDTAARARFTTPASQAMNPIREEVRFVLSLEKPVERHATFLYLVCEGDETSN